jgi:hypothetical protein
MVARTVARVPPVRPAIRQDPTNSAAACVFPALVEPCDKDENGAWDYPTCLRVLRQTTAHALCQRGVGTYKWSFQVGSEKSKLDQTTTCKNG